ncbi:sulfatase-like hydrolase/transferase [bacterium]|nr:sulfatase-like hydrolase/transferase [bacterium]
MVKKFGWASVLLVSLGLAGYMSWHLMRGAKPVSRPNVLIITMDTTRADHLECYGHTRIKTPRINALARNGVLFEEAFSVQPVTLPSHCSIMTGLYPFKHGVRDNSIYRLTDDNLTLAEILKDQGYLTAAFVSSYILDKQFGLTQGFMLYNDRFLKPKQKGKLPVDRRASEVSILACTWFEQNKKLLEKTPFFLWLHYYDPHADYDPPSPYREAYHDPYDGEIAYTDEWIGYVLDELKMRRLLPNTLIVLVADHGESLGEYGEKTHGIFIYRPTTHVPFIMSYPPHIPTGKRIAQRVSTVDLVPTLLDYLGITHPGTCDGRSLRPLVRDESIDEQVPIYSETYIPRSFNWSELKGIRSGDLFYIEAPLPELLVAHQGKNEVENILSASPEKGTAFQAQLTAMLTDERFHSIDRGSVDRTMVDQLKALGYFVTDESGPQDDQLVRSDPKQKVHLFNAQQRASGLIQNDQFEQACELYDSIIAEDPDNSRFLLEFADVLIEHGQTAEAKKHLVHALELQPKAQVFYLLGLCAEHEGDPPAAREAYLNAVRLDRHHLLSWNHLGFLTLNAEEWDQAEQYFRTALQLRPQSPTVLNNLGYIAIKGRNDYSTGITLIEQALELDHENPFLLSSLGWAHYNNSNPHKAKQYLETALMILPDNLMFIDQLEQVYTQLNDTENLQKIRYRKALVAPDEQYEQQLIQ